ncbi:hypothetical protein KEM48_002793 [Puccinia striiformis f. sp. tritici PST-130]|nr:hypothetical protein KEM48_002793 [Puccinia striiformis f. sp. tritici PST-130]
MTISCTLPNPSQIYDLSHIRLAYHDDLTHQVYFYSIFPCEESKVKEFQPVNSNAPQEFLWCKDGGTNFCADNVMVQMVLQANGLGLPPDETFVKHCNSVLPLGPLQP